MKEFVVYSLSGVDVMPESSLSGERGPEELVKHFAACESCRQWGFAAGMRLVMAREGEKLLMAVRLGSDKILATETELTREIIECAIEDRIAAGESPLIAMLGVTGVVARTLGQSREEIAATVEEAKNVGFIRTHKGKGKKPDGNVR